MDLPADFRTSRGPYALFIMAKGKLIFHCEFAPMPRPLLSAPGGAASPVDNAEPLFAICDLFRDWLTTLSGQLGSGEGFRALRTNHYKLHFMTTMTGAKFALMTDPAFAARDGQEALRRIYEGPYVDFVVSDASCDCANAAPVTSASFAAGVNIIVDDVARKNVA